MNHQQSTKSIKIITIHEEYQGQRLDNFLFTYLKGVPKSFIYRIIRKGEVRINKKRVKPEYKLTANDLLRLPPLTQSSQPEKAIFTQGERAERLLNAILYEDKELLVLNKPSGIAVHGGSGVSYGVIEMLRALRPAEHYLELVHRLDKETSGVLLIAKKRSALRALHQQLRDGLIKKEYLALVEGSWPSKIKKVTEPLLKYLLQGGERVVKVNSAGKSAETHFSIERKFSECTLVKAFPITGRTHQIRVHTQYVGHSIAGDSRYTSSEFNLAMQKRGLNRLFLHALRLSFAHPKSGEILQIKAELSEELHYCLSQLS